MGPPTATPTLDPSRPGNNSNEEVFYIPQSSRAGVSYQYFVISRTPVGERVLPIYRDAIGIFYNPSFVNH